LSIYSFLFLLADHNLQGSRLCIWLRLRRSKVVVVMVAAAAAAVDPAPVESDREEMTVVVIATTAAGADTGPTDVCKRCC